MAEDPDGGAREWAEVYVVSDGTGQTAAEAVRAAMAQFQNPWRTRRFPDVRTPSQARNVIDEAAGSNAVVVFTIVNRPAARALLEHGAEKGVPTVDLLGPLIAEIASHLDAKPRHEPGLLHGFSDEYFRRIGAVEFAVRHDDGANTHTLFEADIVLTGASRTSKTPLCMYLAQRGYKTGNVPFVPGLAPPQPLLDIDPKKVFGLLMEPGMLLQVRKERARTFPQVPFRRYADPEAIEQELRDLRRLCRSRGWRIVDVSGRAVEENAARILELLERS